jgi:hypothetical protein
MELQDRVGQRFSELGCDVKVNLPTQTILATACRDYSFGYRCQSELRRLSTMGLPKDFLKLLCIVFKLLRPQELVETKHFRGSH